MIDIFKPEISEIASGLEGKTILVYGTNDTGKTKVACNLEKPYYLPFERGINAQAGIKFNTMQSWADFKIINRQLTNLKTLKQAKEMYQTIIFDTVERAYAMCEKFICNTYGVNRIKEGNSGYGLWRELESEFSDQINLLTSCGYTVYFIAHETSYSITNEEGEEIEKKYPAGDLKRCVRPICDLVDFVVYLKSNGINEHGNVINSSAYFKDSIEHKARSRFTQIVGMIKEYTAENLEKAINDAIDKESELFGTKPISFEEQEKKYTIEKITLKEATKEIQKYYNKLKKEKRLTKYEEIVEKHLGADCLVSNATESQVDNLRLIIDELKDLFDE